MDFDSGAKERSVPRNIDAERSVLGMMLLDQHAIEDVQQILQADDFYLPEAPRSVPGDRRDLRPQDSNVDQLMVEETLSRIRNALEEIGGPGTLIDLAASGTVASVSVGVPRRDRSRQSGAAA
jgi:replicative DNA helicase